MSRQTSKGVCTFCHAEYSKSGMSRHLETCRQRASSEAQREDHQHLPMTSIFHLLVEGHRSPMYWMHLDITASTTLATLDQFLRDIWLECCGHLSAFEIGGLRYTVDEGLFDDEFWSRRQKPMRVALNDVLHPGQTCTYEYDFGSTTELVLKVISQRDAEVREKPIRVIARNSLPFFPCDECGAAPAILTCADCDSDDAGWLCQDCAQKHECGQELLRPRVNSPRVGVCGYVGPNPAFAW